MMNISTAVIPGHRQRAHPLAVNPESRREHWNALLDSGFQRFALAPE
jgi:hypothetical protein